MERGGETDAGKGKMAETLTSLSEKVAAYVAALNGSSSDHHKFSTVRGRKWLKVVDTRPGGPLGGGSVHAFVETTTGDVYKPAGWQAPAKHVRFKLMDDMSYANLLHYASQPSAFSGGYLYL